MTRIARVSGSRSTKERQPEEATSWTVLKGQLQELAQGLEKEQQPHRKEKKKRSFKPTANFESVWTVFETPKLNEESKNVTYNINAEVSNANTDVPVMKGQLQEAQRLGKKQRLHRKEKKKHSFKSTENLESTWTVFEVSKFDEGSKNVTTNISTEVSNTNTDVSVFIEPKKKERREKSPTLNSDTEKSYIETSTTESDEPSKKEKMRNKYIDDSKNTEPVEGKIRKRKNSEPREGKIRKNEFQNNQPYKRRKQEPEKIYVNGREIEVIRYDGYYIKKEDADRIRELRKTMIAEGIPKAEVETNIKLERRRAEKSLAREKKKVCFCCRMAGHILADCPERGDPSKTGTDLCFKCGSTEHTHFECKVVLGDNFRIATCFICKEQGHIARQCPDNPRGLYPRGGACKICGEVTHFKKDCPKLAEEKEGTTITLSTLNDGSLEVLDEDIKKSQIKSQENVKKKKKVVKF